jgi:hypothetical protein
MKTTHFALVLLVGGGVTACGDDTDTTDATESTDQIPDRPALGTQIDRQGRAGVTTALVSVLAEDGPRGDDRDDYNAAARSSWPDFTVNIAGNLAVYDSLDTVCGNQVLAGPDPAAGRYDVLAGALADDRLYVNTAAGACGQYLAVELDATGVAPNQDCGGRTPTYDVIDVTYSAFAVGAVSGVTDGIAVDEASHGDSAFPFLAAP